MKLAIGLLVFFCLVPAAKSAESWSGFLVDANCYETEERNVNPTDTTLTVDRDKDLEIRLCVPTAKTKSFGVVQLPNWNLLKFASADPQVSDLLHKAGKKSVLLVTVTGEQLPGSKPGKKPKDVITVDSISLKTPAK